MSAGPLSPRTQRAREGAMQKDSSEQRYKAAPPRQTHTWMVPQEGQMLFFHVGPRSAAPTKKSEFDTNQMGTCPASAPDLTWALHCIHAARLRKAGFHGDGERLHPACVTPPSNSDSLVHRLGPPATSYSQLKTTKSSRVQIDKRAIKAFHRRIFQNDVKKKKKRKRELRSSRTTVDCPLNLNTAFFPQ